jgi:thiamine biosynthesis lipoprotein
MSSASSPQVLGFAHEAMTTSFELLIAGQEHAYARQAAYAVFDEIDHCEELLSRFDPRSDVSLINRLSPGEAVRVTSDVLDCLELAVRVSRETNGAFDVTFRSKIPRAYERLLLGRLHQNDDPNSPIECLVGLAPGQGEGSVDIDLGAIGKGFALDRITTLLEEDWGIGSALIHSGTSTVLALDPPPGENGWLVGVGGPWGKLAGIETYQLRRRAMSGSGIEVKGEHVLDPRSSAPPRTHQAAWALCDSAALSDALSTAFMVMSTEEVERYCQAHPQVAALVVPRDLVHERPWLFGAWT